MKAEEKRTMMMNPYRNLKNRRKKKMEEEERKLILLHSRGIQQEAELDSC